MYVGVILISIQDEKRYTKILFYNFTVVQYLVVLDVNMYLCTKMIMNFLLYFKVCSVQQMVTTSGTVYYKSGCTDKAVCILRIISTCLLMLLFPVWERRHDDTSPPWSVLCQIA